MDPDAAGRRKVRARQDGYVRLFGEDSGNVGLAARQMPAGEAVLAWANIERRALDLHAAGAEGTAGQLQVQAALDFLLGRAMPPGACPGTHDDAGGSAHEGTHGGAAGRGGAREGTRPGEDGSARQDAHADKAARGGGLGGWAVNPVLLVPWDPSTGGPSGPAGLPGSGLLDQHDTMDLLAAAGLAARLGVTLTPLTTGACQHAHAEPGYTPSRTQRHLIQARNTRCTAPGCTKPAADCDLDHTIPWDDSHLTRECKLAPQCQ